MSFDWTNVEGYREDMSADEKLALLENYEAPKPTEPDGNTDTTPTPAPAPAAVPAPAPKPEPKPGYVSKREFDKVASQLAAIKREQRANMTVEQQKEADRQAEIAAKDEELQSLRREKTLSSHKASFMGLGLDENLANDAATMLVDGDADGLFDTLKRYQVGYEKSMRAKILAETPKPPAGDPNNDEARKKADEQLDRYFGLI